MNQFYWFSEYRSQSIEDLVSKCSVANSANTDDDMMADDMMMLFGGSSEWLRRHWWLWHVQWHLNVLDEGNSLLLFFDFLAKVFKAKEVISGRSGSGSGSRFQILGLLIIVAIAILIVLANGANNNWFRVDVWNLFLGAIIIIIAIFLLVLDLGGHLVQFLLFLVLQKQCLKYKLVSLVLPLVRGALELLWHLGTFDSSLDIKFEIFDLILRHEANVLGVRLLSKAVVQKVFIHSHV